VYSKEGDSRNGMQIHRMPPMLMEDGSDDYWSHANRAAVNGKLVAVESAKTFGLSRGSKDFNNSKKTLGDRQPTQES
jgi:hypothetical protein